MGNEIKKYTSHSFVRYFIIGISSVVIDYLLLLFMYNVLSVRLGVAVTLSFILALIYNFALNKLWAFQSSDETHRKHKRELILYLLLVGFNLIFTNFVIIQLSEQGISPAISKILTTICITLWNYYLYKKYIFKHY